MPDATFNFAEEQTAYVTGEVYKIRHPMTKYPRVAPVETRAATWAGSILYYSLNISGDPEEQAAGADDIPLAGVEMEQQVVKVFRQGIGYEWTEEELNQARMAGVNMSTEKARAAMIMADRYLDDIVMNGKTGQAWDSFIRDSNVNNENAAASWTASGTTADAILNDINAAIRRTAVDTQEHFVANAVALPIAVMAALAGKRITDTSDTVLEFIRRKNYWTVMTGMPLDIYTLPDLATAATNGRAVIYHRHPDTGKIHLPMRFRFQRMWQAGPSRYMVPGRFRTGGYERRQRQAFEYVDGVAA